MEVEIESRGRQGPKLDAHFKKLFLLEKYISMKLTCNQVFVQIRLWDQFELLTVQFQGRKFLYFGRRRLILDLSIDFYLKLKMLLIESLLLDLCFVVN